MSKRNPQLYFDDIREAVSKIELYTKGLTFDQFRGDAKTIDAVVRNIEIIGEAARQISDETRIEYPTVPWELIVGARNKAIHEYFGIDIAILWQTVQEDIPILKRELHIAL